MKNAAKTLAMVGLFALICTAFELRTTLAADIVLGKVVSVTGDTLVSTDVEGKVQKTHTVPKSARVILNGKPTTLDKLTMGDHLKITIEKAGDTTAIVEVEAKSANEKLPALD